MQAKKKKLNAGLKNIYEAQTIVSELDETVERNLDYLMSVNTLTGFLLIGIHKPTEALEFIRIAERIVFKLAEKQAIDKLSQLQIVSASYEHYQSQFKNSSEVVGAD